MIPTNPSYVRMVVKSRGGFERVRVSPATGDVHVKSKGGGWRFYGNTKDLVAQWEAERREKHSHDFKRLLGKCA